MSYEFENETYRGCKIRIIQDESPESPREWDNFGTMVWQDQRNFRLHDKSVDDVFVELTEMASPYFDMVERISGDRVEIDNLSDEQIDGMTRWLDANYVILGMSFIDGGSRGVSMSSHPISHIDDHDGFIYATHTQVVESLKSGDEPWEVTLARARKCLEGEVETYCNYVEGNVAGWVAEDENGETIDSCWGYYPDENGDWSYAIDEAKSAIDYHIKHQEELALQLCQNI